MFTDHDEGRYLFHYTSTEAFLAHILPTRLLRLSPFARLNDPRESKAWSWSVTDDAGVAQSPDFDFFGLQERMDSFIRGRAKLLCLTQDDGDKLQTSAWHHGRGYAHPSLWDRYAGNHSGVCLAFEKGKLTEDLQGQLGGRGLIRHGPVEYADAPGVETRAFNLRTTTLRDLGEDGAARNQVERFTRELFFTKSHDWAAESEYRCLLLDHSQDDAYLDIRSSLRGVIFGSEFAAHTVPMVRRELNDDSVILARIAYQNGHAQPLPAE